MVKVTELLIKSVIRSKPKMLIGLNQKVRGWLIRSSLGLQEHEPPDDRQNLTHLSVT